MDNSILQFKLKERQVVGRPYIQAIFTTPFLSARQKLTQCTVTRRPEFHILNFLPTQSMLPADVGIKQDFPFLIIPFNWNKGH
jgi:hypothetical protein